MGLHHNPRIVTNGLKCLLDPNNLAKHGSTPYTLLPDTTLTATNVGFTEQVDGNMTVFRSDANPTTGSGTAQIVTDAFPLTTGSLTVSWYHKATSDVNVGASNNYRALIYPSDGSFSPFYFLMEQGRGCTLSLTTNLGLLRFLNGVFQSVPASWSAIGQWVMITCTYSSASGLAACYGNGDQIRSGPQMSDTIGTISTGPGDTITSSTKGIRISITKAVSDPAGPACFPGDFGPVFVYDRALTAAEVKQNFEAMRGRFGL